MKTITRLDYRSSATMFVLILVSFLTVVSSTSDQTAAVKERLLKSANQLSLTIFLEPPTGGDFLNLDLVDNSPKKMNLSSEFTKIIREWNPRLLALDPTSPYYFSTFSTTDSEEDEMNLLSYLQAIESNRSTTRPFRHVLPQSYRHALPLLSIFQCSEHVDPASTPFFHNVDLLIGPGQTELPLETPSDLYAYLYCSLSGSPSFLALNQTKESSLTYDAETLLSGVNLAEVDFISTTVAPGSCLFVPPGWTVGALLNNSISLVFSVQKREPPKKNETHWDPWPCTETGGSTLDSVPFEVADPFNVTDIGLVVYFYQYLNPPIFDRQYTAETFLDRFREDKNVSQIIVKWTPELVKLIKESLFVQLDINRDGQFSSDDYFDIKRSNLQQIQNSIYEVLENLRQTVMNQYGDINATITKLAEKLGSVSQSDDPRAAIASLIDELPASIKEKLRQKNAEVAQLLDEMDRKTQRDERKKSSGKQREDDATLLFDRTNDDGGSTSSKDNADQEEEIIAEPAPIDSDSDDEQGETHRTDL